MLKFISSETWLNDDSYTYRLTLIRFGRYLLQSHYQSLSNLCFFRRFVEHYNDFLTAHFSLLWKIQLMQNSH
uniref:Uncharacterized protein n=1 Tax=Anguilla anguilla TaxID=7936 RepID=A0A0E9VVI3_ANGAN